MTARNILIALGLLGVIILSVVVAYLTFPSSAQDEAGENDFFSSLFPFSTSPLGTSDESDDEIISDDEQSIATLRHVTTSPVAGGHFTEDGSILYLDRESGHVYQTSRETSETIRLSNSTLPGIDFAEWFSDTQFVFTLADRSTPLTHFIGEVATGTQNQQLASTALENFNAFIIAPDGESAIAVTEATSGSRVTLVSLDDNTETVLYTSIIRGWVPLADRSSAYILTAPTGDQLGQLYKINGRDSLLKTVGDIPGMLASVSPSGRYVLYSTSGRGAIDTLVYDTESKSHFRLPLKTLATKCAWMPDAEPIVFCGVPSEKPIALYPDAWLMGAVSFNDRAWIMDPLTGVASAVSDLLIDSGGLDVIRPRISDDREYALFMNKNDLSLWSLKLNAR